MTAALALDELRVRYFSRREPALDGVSLAVEAGEIVGVAGRNGAGKSTLALAAVGFIPRVVRAEMAGSVLVADLTTRGARVADLLGRVGIVFSSPASQLSYAKLTVRDELAFGLENLGVPRDEMDPRIDATLHRLSITHLGDRLPTSLSGGEQQRVAIASVLIMGPRALVLDEPTAQLDPAATEEVAQLLAEQAAAGTAVLVTEHKGSVLGRASRILVLDRGRPNEVAAPGRALGSEVGGRHGVAVPALVSLAERAGIDPGLAFDEPRLVAALASPREFARPPGPPAEVRPSPTWVPVRAHDPARIEVHALVHRYSRGSAAVDGVDLAVEPGETVAIVGQNGSGKTTLARHLVGILAPTEGRVRVSGVDLAGRPIWEVARIVGYAFQHPDDQLFERTVAREVAFGPHNLGLDEAATARLRDQALAAVGLASEAATNPYDLDLADRKLVAIASVLAMDPAILVLDEPTTGQDASGVERVGGVVEAFAAAGRTVIAIVHDMEFAARQFRRVVVMRAGRIVADGPPRVVFSPANKDLLTSTGLTLPPLVRIGVRLGLGATPTESALVEALAGRQVGGG